MLHFLKTGLVRGLLTAPLAFALGAGLVALIRRFLGLNPLFAPGPVTAVGAVFSVPGFLIGVGAFNDWLRWTRGIPAAPPAPPEVTPYWLRFFNFDPNHKVIGIQYIVTGLIVMSIAGGIALAMRAELSLPGLQVLSADGYNTALSLHGILMIYIILVNVAGLGNYLVPLMLGIQDMAFPRLNALSFWLTPPAGVMVLSSIAAGGFNTGWTGYPPLGLQAPLGIQFFYLGVFFLGFSSIIGSVNFLTTILKLRAPGMTLFRMPIFVWGILSTAIIQLIATQFIAMAFLMVVIERLLGISFFNPAGGGSAILFQHIFWFYSHPVVYVFVLPGFGIISELLPVFARKPLFGYQWIALSSMAIAIMGFLVWAHHMFATGLGTSLSLVFMISTLLVSIPTGVKIFSWLATIWGGKLSFEPPLLFTVGAIFIFLLGGLTGPFLALVPVDLYLTETYWVVAHFHQTMFGGFVFPFVAAIYFWFPKMTGYRTSERLGQINFILLLVGFLMQSLFMYRIGLSGMLRRVVDYIPQPNFTEFNILISIGGTLVGLSFLVFFINIVRSLILKIPAPANPWNARSPEWQISSPPPEENYPVLPRVVNGPYDYGVPGSTYIHFDKPEGH